MEGTQQLDQNVDIQNRIRLNFDITFDTKCSTCDFWFTLKTYFRTAENYMISPSRRPREISKVDVLSEPPRQC